MSLIVLWPYDYTVRDIPEPRVTDAPAALHPEPQRKKDIGNNNKEINTEIHKSLPQTPSREAS